MEIGGRGRGNHWGCGQRKGGGGRGSKGQERENIVRALHRNVIRKGMLWRGTAYRGDLKGETGWGFITGKGKKRSVKKELGRRDK